MGKSGLIGCVKAEKYCGCGFACDMADVGWEFDTYRQRQFRGEDHVKQKGGTPRIVNIVIFLGLIKTQDSEQ